MADSSPQPSGGYAGTATAPGGMTNAQLLREIELLRELLFVRLDGVERAQEKFENNLTRVPTDVDRAVGQLRELHQEKFDGIAHRFEERDIRLREQGIASDTALRAALQAQKDAAAIQEANTREQIGQQRVLLDRTTLALSEKVEDLKGRLLTLESTSTGRQSAGTDMRAWLASGIGVVLFAIALVTFYLQAVN